MISLKEKRILLGITGGIAAYKSCELTRLLKKAGADVRIIMTESAKQFVGEATFAALSGQPVSSSLWDNESKINHIALVENTDLIVVAPATANILAKAANGIADDLLSTCILARRSPIMFAPAMNKNMWSNPATQRNVSLLSEDGVLWSGPEAGSQACGDIGLGRMREPAEIFNDLLRFFSKPVLKGRKVLITAGPTFEGFDPVRGLTNKSSGKQGIAIAKAAWYAGADVTLVCGPCPVPSLRGIKRMDVVSAQEMLDACLKVCKEDCPDLFFGVAAVCDWKPTTYSKNKIKKDGNTCHLPVDFVQNPDILSTVSHLPNPPVCIGFAAETDNLIEYAKTKLQKKKVSMIVANDAQVIGKDTNRAYFVEANEITEFDEMTKETLAEKLIQKAAALLQASE